MPNVRSHVSTRPYLEVYWQSVGCDRWKNVHLDRSKDTDGQRSQRKQRVLTAERVQVVESWTEALSKRDDEHLRGPV